MSTQTYLMRYLLAVFLIGFLPYMGSSQIGFISDTSATHALSYEAAKLFSKNEVGKVVDILQPYWPLPQEELDAFELKTLEYLDLYKERFGEAIGILRLKEEHISDIALRETYLVRYEVMAIRLIFTYYRGNSGWIVNSFKWDDSFAEEFKE